MQSVSALVKRTVLELSRDGNVQNSLHRLNEVCDDHFKVVLFFLLAVAFAVKQPHLFDDSGFATFSGGEKART